MCTWHTAATLSGVRTTRGDGPCAGVGKSFLAVRAATRNGVSNAGKELAGAINARKEILFVRSKYTHAYTALRSRRRGRSLAPGRCGLSGTTASGNTAEFLVPRANAPCRRRRAVVRRGLRDRRHWPKKTHSFSQQRSRKTWRRGAPRSARKNIIYVRHDGRPIVRRFTPRPLFVLILSRSDIIHADGALNSPRYLKFCTFRFWQLSWVNREKKKKINRKFKLLQICYKIRLLYE